jgi:hypothetical protein
MKLRNPKSTKWFEYELDTDEAKARFEVGLLPLEVKNWLLDNREIEIARIDLVTGREITDRITQDKKLDALTVKFGLKGLENVFSADGKKVHISTVKEKINDKEYDVISNDLLDELNTMNLIGWISFRVWKFQIVTEEEKKTSN